MNFVIDASIAIKWVVDEANSREALRLRHERLFAPELLVAECANVLWKKVRRGELMLPEALLAGRLIERAGIQFHALRPLMERAQNLAAMLDHAVYDCFYLALAEAIDTDFITADRIFAQKVRGIDMSRVRMLSQT